MPANLPTLDLHRGLPTWEQARPRVVSFIKEQRRLKTRAVKIIHGQGSSQEDGSGGTLKRRLPALLAELQSGGELRAFFPGAEFRPAGRGGDYLRDLPFLRQDEDFGKANPGITIVILR